MDWIAWGLGLTCLARLDFLKFGTTAVKTADGAKLRLDDVKLPLLEPQPVDTGYHKEGESVTEDKHRITNVEDDLESLY